MGQSSTGLVLVLVASALGTTPVVLGDQGAAPGPGLALHLRAGVVDTSGQGLDLSSLKPAAGERHILQLDGPITPQRRARMQAAGIAIGDYLPDCAYIVSLERTDLAAVSRLEFIRWVGQFQNAWKVDPDLGRRAYATPERQALLARSRDRMVVTSFAGADVGAVEKALFAAGAQVHGEETLGQQMEIYITAPLGALPRIATIPGVQYIEPAPEILARNISTRWIVQSNIPGQTPLYAAGLRGQGQVLGLQDDGFNPNHCSFSDPANPIGPLHRKVLAINSINGSVNSSQHGTHTAGIAVGDGGVDTAETRGVAYLSKMVVARWPAFTEAGMNATLSLHHSQGARLHSNSWGDDGTTAYNSLCRGIDIFQYNNEDSLVLFAVTNQPLLKNPENAKNLLAVGNSGDTPNQATICTGGAGPTSDGRRKPEIWAPGCNVQSAAWNTTCGTTGLTGTSMACPAVTGTGMLVRQYYMDGFYPQGEPSANSITPSAALVKATLLNSCVDMAPAGYPSNAEGWGRVLADNALYFAGETPARRLLISDVRNADGLSSGAQAEMNVNVVGSGLPVRVTLVWTEPPAAAGAANAAVNDLDLEVVDANGALYLGNVFNTSLGVSVTGGAKDPRNNVEQVHLLNPATGAWTVRVKGANVAVGTQGYAIVVTGDIQSGTLPPLMISLPSGYPNLVPPGIPTDIDVRIRDGSQTLIPGSAAMSYRMTGSSQFTTIPLTSMGGEMFRGTLPPAYCDNTPQFYFSAQGDGGATVSLPGNAPASTFSTTVGTVTTVQVASFDFASGLPAGWTTTGLWHAASGCAPGGTCGSAPWMYYGQDATCTFDTGATNSGNLTSAPIALPTVPAGGSITLTYCSAKISENDPTYDQTTLAVNGTVVDTVGDSPSWEMRTVDLTPYAGQTVTLRWRFDTVDGVLNSFRGWHVDNVAISAAGTVCNNTCYPNCDGSTAAPILNVLDFNCFLNKFSAGDPYANCDNSTAPPILNVLDFNCFLNKFSAGCP
jgi:hypothetical protein